MPEVSFSVLFGRLGSPNPMDTEALDWSLKLLSPCFQIKDMAEIEDCVFAPGTLTTPNLPSSGRAIPSTASDGTRGSSAVAPFTLW